MPRWEKLQCSIKFSRRKISRKKLERTPGSASDRSHTSKTTQVPEQAKRYEKKIKEVAWENPGTGQWQIYLQ